MSREALMKALGALYDEYSVDKAISAIKEALAQQDAEAHLQAVADFGQLQALSEPSECWDCFCIQENAQDNDVICDPCRWAKEAASQPAQSALLKSEITPRALAYPLEDYHTAMTEGPLHLTWTDKPHRLVYDLIAAVNYYSVAQPAQEQSCAKQDVQRHHDYVCGFNEGYDRAEKFYNKGAKS